MEDEFLDISIQVNKTLIKQGYIDDIVEDATELIRRAVVAVYEDAEYVPAEKNG